MPGVILVGLLQLLAKRVGFYFLLCVSSQCPIASGTGQVVLASRIAPEQLFWRNIVTVYSDPVLF